ncbi:DUF1287 domain-containing protein [Bifidobacterium oedipodis]|uniref:DUF1287 domain-containing protein n=1 Tax=Bifidobacterium oedipodis TaxID=2675322 RepID=A0A7Y0HTR2_9BIFI|nr:DUF1287 domain-containing protein [Bifidobacterium sp. DSM 109957]NMM94352.1 hypothetical protein [Bifidobacterium sp. DSM 109957]
MARHIGMNQPDVPHYRRHWRVIAATMVVTLIIAASAGMLMWRHFGGIPSLDGVTAAPQSETEARYPKLTSSVDYDGDGIDDYTDINQGAQADSAAKPTYDSGYYEGGYPPDDRGACTDVVWRAFKNAGYDLKAMVDADVAADPSSYAAVAPAPDPNIDFRRTGVLNVFFGKYAQSLTTDTADYAQWQQGDIVVFQTTKHIGVISDKRDSKGTAFVNHNMGQQQRENDYLAFAKHMNVTGHYRWDASQVPQSVLRAWQE